MRKIALLATALLLSACGHGPAEITGPVDQSYIVDGLEHELKIKPADPAWFPSGKAFTLTSRLINRGDTPRTVHVATCWLDPKHDMRTRATFISWVQPDCVMTPNVLTLAPGEATPSLSFTGEIEWPGHYTFEVRHAQDPEIWSKIEVTAR
jgi:hypothetical protein